MKTIICSWSAENSSKDRDGNETSQYIFFFFLQVFTFEPCMFYLLGK